jgi:hypothetical protein
MGKGYQQHLPLGYWPLAMQPGWQAGQNGTVNGMEAWSLGQTERCLLVPRACRRAPCAHSSSTSWLVDRWRRVLLVPTTSVQGSKAPRARVLDKTRQIPSAFPLRDGVFPARPLTRRAPAAVGIHAQRPASAAGRSSRTRAGQSHFAGSLPVLSPSLALCPPRKISRSGAC